jgi:hypothetical protein
MNACSAQSHAVTCMLRLSNAGTNEGVPQFPRYSATLHHIACRRSNAELGALGLSLLT